MEHVSHEVGISVAIRADQKPRTAHAAAVGLAPGQRLYSGRRVVAAKSCDAATRVAPTIGGSVPLEARNPANETE